MNVLSLTCRYTVMDPNTCTLLPPNAFILTVGGSRVSHSSLDSSFAWLYPITLHPAPVSTSQSICWIGESLDLDIHAGRICSEFLSLSWQTSAVSVCSIFTEVRGRFVSFLDMKKGGGALIWLLQDCVGMGVVLRLWAFTCLCWCIWIWLSCSCRLRIAFIWSNSGSTLLTVELLWLRNWLYLGDCGLLG